MQCYIPTNDSSEYDKDNFYYNIKNVLEEIPTYDALVVMVDLDAKIGNKSSVIKKAKGNLGAKKL